MEALTLRPVQVWRLRELGAWKWGARVPGKGQIKVIGDFDENREINHIRRLVSTVAMQTLPSFEFS